MTDDQNAKSLGTATQTLVDFVEGWAERSDTTADELCRQLLGYDLPAVGRYEEPHQMLLKGLQWSARRQRVERIYAERVRDLLHQCPDVERPGRRPDDLLYNLFTLCAGLDRPDELAEILQAVEQRQRQETTLDELTRGALRSALIMNQRNADLWELWRTFYRQDGDDLLPGTPFDGFEGALFMPARDEDGDPVPHFEAIGEALGGVANWLEEEKVYERRQRFRETTHRVKAAFPDHDDWDEQFIIMADRHTWPRWAIESLDRTTFSREVLPDASERMWIWHYILACVPESWIVRRDEPRCGRIIQDVVLVREGAEYVRNIALQFENLRRTNPFPSERSIRGLVAHVLTTLQLTADTEAQRIHRLLDQFANERTELRIRLDGWESIAAMLRHQALSGYQATIAAVVAVRDIGHRLNRQANVFEQIVSMLRDADLTDEEREFAWSLSCDELGVAPNVSRPQSWAQVVAQFMPSLGV